MSTTGGGRGTNQYRIRSVDAGAALPPAAPGEPDWEALLREYPSYPGDVQAVPNPRWTDLSDSVRHLVPKGRDRAVERYRIRESRALYNDARLEGLGFTEPEIITLLNGGHVAGHTEGEEAQVAGLKQAGDHMVDLIDDDAELEPAKTLSDELHLFIARPLGLKSIAFRGDQREQYEGPRVQLDRGERFRAVDARVTPAVLEAGLTRIQRIAHPVVRGATWAAFATYEQFYLDGNKRTGRYVMNAVLMSHGFDAILIPDSLKAPYEDALVESYRTGDLTPHIRFLLDQYHDD